MGRANRQIRAALLATVCAAAVAACGSSGGTAGTRTSAASDSSGLRFATCMRHHGLPNFPDPGLGSINLAETGIDPASPAFKAARSACGRFAPVKATPVTMSAAQRRTALRFAECMRSHGVTSFPDPGAGPQSNRDLVLSLHGVIFPVGAGVDPTAPGFRRAAQACGVTLPTVPPH